MAQCFHCSHWFSGKIGRQDACAKCSSDLHVCRNCKFHDTSSYNECREPSAERVVDKEKRNFCDYFSPADKTNESEKTKNLKALDDLFKK